MKKLTTTLFLVLLLALTSMVGVTSATPIDELTDLAEFAPEDTLFFATLRTDDAYIETWDGLLARVLEVVPDAPEATVADLLSMGLSDMMGAPIDFETDIRPWLGDNIAVTVASFNALNALSNPFTLILDLADAEAAEAAFEPMLFGYTAEETEDGTLYTGEFSSEPAYLFTDDALFIGDLTTGINRMVMPSADTLSLDQNEAFTATLDMLPEDEYNIVAYINPGGVVNQVAALIPLLLGQQVEGLSPQEISEAIGTQALGFTILEDRVLSMDYAVISEFSTESTPIDLELLSLVPADTPLLIQTQGAGNFINTLFGLLELLEDALAEFEIWPTEDAGPFANIGPTDLGTFIRLSVEGTFSIDLDETLDWMSNDALTYTSLMIDEDADVPVRLGNGNIMTTDNPEATAAFVEGQAARILNVFNTATFEDGVITIPVGAVFSQPDTNKIASTDTFYVSGTSDLVDFALAPGESLLDTDTYAFESGLFLEGTATLWYIDMAPIREAFDVAVASGMLEDMADMGMGDMDMALTEENAAVISDLLGLLDTSSITSVSGDGDGVSRFTLTLGE